MSTEATSKDDSPEAASVVREGQYVVAACAHAIIATLVVTTGWHRPSDRALAGLSAAVIALLGVFWLVVFFAHRYAPHLLQEPLADPPLPGTYEVSSNRQRKQAWANLTPQSTSP